MRLTPTAKLADYLLPGGLEDFVTTRRDQGKSWRRIALDIYDTTDKQITISHEALIRWFDRDGAKS